MICANLTKVWHICGSNLRQLLYYEPLLSGRMEIKMKIKKSIMVMLAISAVTINTMNVAAFSTGKNSKDFTKNGIEGTVSVVADVNADKGSVGYRYIGSMRYGKKASLKVSVTGYYFNDRGYLCRYYDVGNADNKKNVTTSYSYISGCSSAVCDSNYKCSADAYVNGTRVQTVYYPN